VASEEEDAHEDDEGEDDNAATGNAEVLAILVDPKTQINLLI
jgi:hypothetical protein